MMAMMALNHTGAQIMGTGSPTSAEDDLVYTKILRVQDAVINGSHPKLKLSPAAIGKLKAALAATSAPAAVAEQAAASTVANGAAFTADAAAEPAQPSSAPIKPPYSGLPGLQPSQPSCVGNDTAQRPALQPTASGLNPIFLEKSDHLVRAENELKRQRIERDLQAQLEQRKNTTRDRDPGPDAHSMMNVEAIYTASLLREAHVSGLKPAAQAGSDTSFDENDYYSSQVESAPFTASYPDPNLSSSTKSAGKQPVKDCPHVAATRPEPAYEVQDDDEDDEYEPPDPAALGADVGDNGGADDGQITPDDDDDDDENYEPGEIPPASNMPASYYHDQQAAPPALHVPVIRNHLTHIAAPQPSRVSPLATNLEIELVNGRPELVKPRHAAPSRSGSTASPNGAPGGNNKKKRTKKRKRDSQPELAGRNKRKRDKQNGAHEATNQQGSHIKDEPVSPPPFDANIPEAPLQAQRPAHYRPPESDVVTPRYAPQQFHSLQDAARASGLRYEYAAPTSPAVARVASPGGYRPVQKDNQDLRRIASLHNVRRPASPVHRAYSPAAQRTVCATYGDPRITQAPADVQATRYYEQPAEPKTYVRERSPLRLQQYHDPYGARPQSPAAMPPPAAPPRRIVIDQYGNQYYAAESQPAPAPPPASSRASVAPVDKRAAEPGYERAPSRMETSYGQAAPGPASEQPDARMAPPPLPRRHYSDERPVRYVDANGHPVQQCGARPEVRYVDAPMSPVFPAASAPRYDMAPPPARPAREQTSPVYAAPARSYSVRPEAATAAPSYERHASVAPVQYVRQEAGPPPRAMSLMPGYEQARVPSYEQARVPSYEQARVPSYAPAPQAVRYVDQYGRPLYPHAPAPEYRYQ